MLSRMALERLLEACRQEQKRRLEKAKQYDWLLHARPNQLPPEGSWRIWIILAGRGFGKTRAGAETIRLWMAERKIRRVALVGSSLGEVRDVMVEGESGLLSVYPEPERPKFEPSKRRLTWPHGAIATLFAGDHYEQLRGPQFDCAWVDELAKFNHARQAWDQLMLGLRLGPDPRCIVTTTPRPIKIIHELLAHSEAVVTRGTTFENQVNLAPAFFQQILKQYEGTRLASQELYAELLTEQEGALWRRDLIHYQQPEEGALSRIVIAIDPAITHTETSDETGIIVAGLSKDKKAYVLEDLSGRLSPGDWGKRAIEAYWRLKADRVVAEVNKGGDMVERILRSLDPVVSYKAVRASRGKATRAEPIVALYEQKRVFHARPLATLEAQLCDYIPGVSSKSPDRLDALVWGLTDLLLEREATVPKVWLA